MKTHGLFYMKKPWHPSRWRSPRCVHKNGMDHSYREPIHHHQLITLHDIETPLIPACSVSTNYCPYSYNESAELSTTNFNFHNRSAPIMILRCSKILLIMAVATMMNPYTVNAHQ
jgi:hypothetical protein